MSGNLLNTAKNARKAIDQSKAVNTGNTKLVDHLIIPGDADAQSIVKGKQGK